MTASRIIDSHCHLSHPQLQPDTRQALQRAAAAGVGACIVPAVDLASSYQVVGFAERYSGLHGVVIGVAVGLHPQEVVAATDAAGLAATLAELRQLATQPAVVAIGEIGLDFSRNFDAELQTRWLQAQLELAAELQLPVIIHNRDAAAAVRNQLGHWRNQLGSSAGSGTRLGVLHAFSGDAALARWACASGFALGAGGIATFKRETELRQTLAGLPKTHVVLETDAPYLAPEPVRGGRNEPAFVRHVAACLAQARQEQLEVIAAETTAAALALFPRLAPLLPTA